MLVTPAVGSGTLPSGEDEPSPEAASERFAEGRVEPEVGVAVAPCLVVLVGVPVGVLVAVLVGMPVGAAVDVSRASRERACAEATPQVVQVASSRSVASRSCSSRSCSRCHAAVAAPQRFLSFFAP